MDRRNFLSGVTESLTGLLDPEGGKPAGDNPYANKTIPKLDTSTAGIQPYSGTWGSTQLIHLLRRTTFGPKKSDIDAFSGKTIDQVVDALLTAPTTAPSPPINFYASKYVDPYCKAGDTWVTAQFDPTGNAYRGFSLKAWWTGLMLNQGPSIQEKMVLFLQNHFVTDLQNVKDARLSYINNALLRQYALGNFKDLTRAISKDPAMLIYLNGIFNTKTAPDENYGRELQELFTIGKGPDSHYTEDDVKAAARVLTGWRLDKTTGLGSLFDVSKHDTGDKQFSSFYNNKLIKGRNTSTAGDDELNDLMDMIFSTTECAKYIVRRLYRFFVYYVIDSNVESNVITPLADTLRSNNYDLKPVLSQLFKSDHFYDASNIGCMIKSPLDHLVGMARQTNMVFPTATDYVTQYFMWNFMEGYTTILQQDVYGQPNVAGWPAYYQEPQYYEIWINSDTLPKRNQFTDTMVYANYKYNGFTLNVDVLAFTASTSNPADPNQLMADCIQLFFPNDLTSNQKSFLKSILLSGQSADHYWSDAWSAYTSNPSDKTNKQIVTTRLQQFIGYMFDMAEYQLS